MIGQRASTNAVTDVALGTNKVVLGPRLMGAAEEGGGRASEAEMEDAGEKEATGEAEDIMMTETVNTTVTETEIGAETEMGALATND